MGFKLWNVNDMDGYDKLLFIFCDMLSLSLRAESRSESSVNPSTSLRVTLNCTYLKNHKQSALSAFYSQNAFKHKKPSV